MSSDTATPPPLSPETPVVAPPTEQEFVVDRRLLETRRYIKGVDIAGGALSLMIGMLVFLLTVAVVDHWIVAGGLGFWGRFVLWLLLLGGGAGYFIVRLLPPLTHRINPIFAASTIEQSQPSLKNSLINFLLLRGHRREVAPIVYQAMEQRAAADLSGVQVELAVDRARIVRLGCVLAAVVALFALYLVVSPKNPLRSAARILFPWSEIAAPTRVTISDVQPGDSAVYYDDAATVSAEIAGLAENEPAMVIYSTADGQTVDEAVPLSKPQGEYRHQCRLPPGKIGLRQDIQYYLKAGDCQTRPYRLRMQIAPAIVVDKVTYHYPPYTGIADRTVQRQGDLAGIEGTEATIYATANASIKPDTAEIDLGCTGRHGLRMSIEDRTAVGRITLRLDPNDPSRPQYDSYQLRFADLDGRENQRPIRHRIEVVRDLPPEVLLIEPEQKEIELAADGWLPIRLQAEDPDFGLRRVVLRAECDGRGLTIPPLLSKRPPEKAHTGPFEATYQFEPKRLGLKPGDRVQYWAEAEDNKEPDAGRAASEKQWIVIGRPDPGAAKSGQEEQSQSEDQTEKNGRKNQAARDKNAKSEPNASDQDAQESSDQGEEGQKSAGGEQSGQSGSETSPSQDQLAQSSEKPSERIDPEAAPGDAMQEILKDRQKEQEKSSENQQQQSSDEPQPSEQQQDQSQQSGEPSEGGQQSGESSDESKSGEQSSGQSKSGGAQSQESASNDQQPGEPSSGEAKQGGKQSGGGKSGQQQPGETASSEQPSGEPSSGAAKQGGKQSGGGKSGKQPGETTSSEQPSGEPSSGEAKQDDATDPSKKSTDRQSSGGQGSKKQDDYGQKPDGKTDPSEQSGDRRSGDMPSQGDERQYAPENDKEAQAGDAQGKERPDADMTGGEQMGSASGKDQEQPAGKEPYGKERSGEPQPDQKPSTGAGKNAGDESASPLPQEGYQARDKKPYPMGEKPGEQNGDEAQSPGTSKKQSDSQGETAGDRTGGGEKGGGQQSDQRGVGGPGSHTPEDEGGSSADEPGEGELGQKPGDTPGAKSPNQSSNGKTASGDQNSQQSASGDHAGDASQSPASSASPSSDGSSDGQAQGRSNVGGQPGQETGSTAPRESIDTQTDRANLEYARRQSALALEHLRDQLAKEKPELLERLGWTKDDARRFLDRWEQMRKAASEKGPAGDAARKAFDDALRSLDLHPRGTELRHGGVAPEGRQNLRDAGRFAPPPDWAEQYREYTRGVAGERQE